MTKFVHRRGREWDMNQARGMQTEIRAVVGIIQVDGDYGNLKVDLGSKMQNSRFQDDESA